MPDTEVKEILTKAVGLFFESLSTEFHGTVAAYDGVPTWLRKPNCGIRQWKVRLLPVTRLPRTFWTSKWCYYEMGVGPNGGGNFETATCAFMWAPNQTPQGAGAYEEPIDRILKRAEEASKGVFRIRWIGPKNSSQLLCCSFRGNPNPPEMAKQMKWLIENTLKEIQSLPSI